MLAAAVVAGCNFNATLPTSDPGLNAVADTQFRDLVGKRDEALIARMSSENKPADIVPQLPMMRDLVASTVPPAPKVVSTRKTTSTAGKFYDVLQDYDYADRVAHVTTHFKSEDGAWKVTGFFINVTMKPAAAPLPSPPETSSSAAPVA